MENITSSKLFTTRQGTIFLGVIAAVIAAIALIVYLNNYRSSVTPPPVQVLVAKKTIPVGTSGDVLAKSTSFYEVARIPHSQLQSGAITDTATLAGKVALVEINPNSQLTAAQFGPAEGIAHTLGPHQRAVTVSLDSPQSVGGQITANSHVDVWVTSSSQGSSGVSRPVAKLLFQNMIVMNAGTSGGNVTLEATPTQAGQLIYASTNDQIWLALRPTIGTITKPPVISAGQVTGG